MHNRQCLAEHYDQHETHMFRIKICGITNVDDALASTDAGADAIGINFYSGSKRCVNSRDARKISTALQDRCLKVGVFVDHAANDLNTLAEEVGLDAVQLHGDQLPQFLKFVRRQSPVIRVHRITDASLDQVVSDIAACELLGRVPNAVLIDAATSGEFGGTGRTLEWSTLAGDAAGLAATVPLILAGGLTPENVREAIRTVRPYGVDVASGVESSLGKKDPAKVREFIAEARRGFAEIGVL